MLPKKMTVNDKAQPYRRWELEALDQPEQPQPQPSVDVVSAVEMPKPEDLVTQVEQSRSCDSDVDPQAIIPTAVAMPSEEEIAAIVQQAKDRGYTDGYQQGHAAGYTDGRSTAEAEVKSEITRMQAILSQLDHDLHTVDQSMADQLLELAIALAGKIVARSLVLKPELIVPIVQEAIRNLPNAMQHPRIYLHPDDAKLVLMHLSERIAEEHWSIREDERLSRGGCRIELNGCEIDGELDVRWRKVVSAIGYTNDWFDGDEQDGEN
ncbi:MAG: flagellar assembly protein FliH [Nitrosomonas sp.]|nr:MAG: flagellar assembly protein FliH [Nitrosomonas sp.]